MDLELQKKWKKNIAPEAAKRGEKFQAGHSTRQQQQQTNKLLTGVYAAAEKGREFQHRKAQERQATANIQKFKNELIDKVNQRATYQRVAKKAAQTARGLNADEPYTEQSIDTHLAEQKGTAVKRLQTVIDEIEPLYKDFVKPSGVNKVESRSELKKDKPSEEEAKLDRMQNRIALGLKKTADRFGLEKFSIATSLHRKVNQQVLPHMADVLIGQALDGYQRLSKALDKAGYEVWSDPMIEAMDVAFDFDEMIEEDCQYFWDAYKKHQTSLQDIAYDKPPISLEEYYQAIPQASLEEHYQGLFSQSRVYQKVNAWPEAYGNDVTIKRQTFWYTQGKPSDERLSVIKEVQSLAETLKAEFTPDLSEEVLKNKLRFARNVIIGKVLKEVDAAKSSYTVLSERRSGFVTSAERLFELNTLTEEQQQACKEAHVNYQEGQEASVQQASM